MVKITAPNPKIIDIELAVMSLWGIRQNVIVPNISFGHGVHECDLFILTKSDCTIEVEIKTSMADLKKDVEKPHGHRSKKIRQLYFALPDNIIEKGIEHVPERAGIISISYLSPRKKFVAKVIREAKVNKDFIKPTEQEKFNITRLGCMRIYGLKSKLKQLI